MSAGPAAPPGGQRGVVGGAAGHKHDAPPAPHRLQVLHQPAQLDAALAAGGLRGRRAGARHSLACARCALTPSAAYAQPSWSARKPAAPQATCLHAPSPLRSAFSTAALPPHRVAPRAHPADSPPHGLEDGFRLFVDFLLHIVVKPALQAGGVVGRAGGLCSWAACTPGQHQHLAPPLCGPTLRSSKVAASRAWRRTQLFLHCTPASMLLIAQGWQLSPSSRNAPLDSKPSGAGYTGQQQRCSA